MHYKLLLLDIDGTLRPDSCERIPRENAEAVNAVQRAGVKIAIAATHTAIAPVAVNFHCWVARRSGLRIYPDGRMEKLL